MVHENNLPAALPYPIEDQREGFKAIKAISVVRGLHASGDSAVQKSPGP
jgi:hypothetical protein